MKCLSLFILILMLSYGTLHAQEITKQEKGYFNLTELGYFFSSNQTNMPMIGGSARQKYGAYALSLRNINGLFITNNLSLGVGVGLDGYTFKMSESIYDNTFLLFGDVRYYLKNERNTFFGYGDLGSSVAIDDNIANGLFFDLGLGYKFKISNRTGMSVSMGYNRQNINHDHSSIKENYSSFTVKLGLLF